MYPFVKSYFKLTLILLISLFTLTSCWECYPEISGKIVDSLDTPISNAKIILGNFETFSNEKGVFSLTESRCGELNLKIIKEGYKPFEVLLSHKNDYWIYKIKSKSHWVKYKTPFFPNKGDSSIFYLGEWEEFYSQKLNISPDSLTIYLDELN